MANATIKITQLPNIGNNLGANTLLPVVDTTGTAVTDKVTVGNIANFILTEAGNLLPEAFVSQLSYSVANAAQPNITSVGTLNINTLHISGGTNGQYLQTDGDGGLSWVSGGGSGNGEVGGANTQIQFNDAGNFGGDPELTWDAGNNQLNTVNFAASHAIIYGNVDVVNVNATGNLVPNAIYTDHYYYANGYVFGGGGGNGAPSGSNTQVQFNDNGAFGGNTGFTFNKTTGIFTSPFLAGNGNGLSNIQGANVSGAVGLATYAGTANSVAGANVSGAVSYAGTANSVAVGNVVGIGNIATVALNGNGSQYLRGNGTWGNAGSGSSISNGISNVNIPTSSGAVEVTAGTQHWAFGTDGTLTAPNDSQIVPAGNNFNIYTNDVSGAVQFFTDVTGNNHNWAFDGYGYTQLPFSQGFTNTAVITSVGAGNIMLQAGAGPTQNFMFGSDGAVTFPTLTVDLHNGGNQTAQTLQFGDASQQAIITGPTPAANVNAQRLIIQGQRGNGTGEGGDVYFWAGDADTNGGDIKIYAGDADSGTGSGGYINIDAGNGPDSGGQLSLSGGYSSNGQGGTVNIGAGQGGTDGGAVNINGGGAGTNQGGNIALTGGYGGNNGGEVRLTGGSAGTGLPGYGNVVLVSGASTWTFDNAGVLNLPGGTSTIESTANNISIYSDAGQLNGALFYDTGSEIYALQDFAIFTDNANTSKIWRYYANGVMTAPGAINVGNMSIGALPGYITADANTGIILNTSGSDGGFVVDYLKEDGNANTSGGELAFSSETGNATYRISLSDDLGNGFATKIWRFDGTGNLTLPGNTFAVNYANGTQVSLGGGGNTGNVTFNDQVVQGTGDEYGGSGLYLAPGTNSTANLQFLRVRGGDYPTHIHLDTGNNNYFDQYFGADFRYVKLEANGNIVINADDDEGNSATWTFDTTGDLHLASGNSVISSLPNNAGDGSGLSTLNLYPDNSTGDDRYLIIDPTGPAHLHLRAGGLQDASNVLLYLGGEQTYVQVDDGYHRVTIGSYDIGNTTGYNWRFDYDGNLVLPLNTFAVKYANGTQVPIVSSASGSNNQIQFNSNGAFGASANYTFTDTVGGGSVEIGNELLLLGNGTISTANSNLNIQPAGNLVVSASAYNWTFDTAGNLTLPGNTFAVNYANGTQVSLGGGSYGDSNVVSLLSAFGSNTITTTGNISVGNIAGNTNGYTLGYLNIPQVSASNTTLALGDAGKHYYSTTAGNLTLTIPLNSSVAFPTGTAISIVVQAAGNVLVNAASGVTLYMAGSSSAGNRTVGTYGMATLMKVASDTWFINGTGVY